MNALKIVAVDDEILALRRVRRALDEIDGVALVGEADGCTAALDLVRRMQPANSAFEYDTETYVVSQQYARAAYRYGYPYTYGGPFWSYDPWWGFRRFGYYGFYGPRRIVVVPHRGR